MEAYKTEATIDKNGTLRLGELPFAEGERVQVILLPSRATPADKDAYPLRGTPYRYDDPTEPVVADAWDAAN
jgi:hypothetical protein